MGICYEVIMQDEFNWDYADSGKKERLKKFEDEIEKEWYRPTKIAEWYGKVIYDFNKIPPYIEPYKSIILKNCSHAWFFNDSEEWKLEELS